MSIKKQWIETIEALQNDICFALEKCDGKATFEENSWQRPDGGGGKTRIIANGAVFEKGGVNTSIVFGTVTETMRKELNINGDKWFACGLSLVLHPSNPFVPTVHCNYRMFELYDQNDQMISSWFGGGTDLTPYYLFDEDAMLFHQTYKTICDRFDPSFYSTFKTECDNYFVNEHRNNERRGIGGIFYDHQKPDTIRNTEFWLNFSKSCGYGLIDSYIPIVERRKNIPFLEAHKHWQEIRRGRYVEFNLLHDRGTIFGLKTKGRTESILMSLPPTVRFEYDHHPVARSEEDHLLQACLTPREWV
jgi:coproporphyrinogen III oxidase